MARSPKKTDLQLAELRRAADGALTDIARLGGQIARLQAESEQAVQAVTANYRAMIEPLEAGLEKNVAWLHDTMKGNRAQLFGGGDLVDLPHGMLIRSVADRVKIPRDALARCEELGFAEAIRVAKSLDREKVEKWPDERLFLIGAERRSREEFSYDLKPGKDAE